MHPDDLDELFGEAGNGSAAKYAGGGPGRRLILNGIDGSSGEYLLPPMTPRQILEILRRRNRIVEFRRGVPPGVDAGDIASSGWGVVFPAGRDPAVRDALEPLLEHRRAQATRLDERRFRVFEGHDGYLPGMSKDDFLRTHGTGPGVVDPDRVPYHLLLVGSPSEIPFRVQEQLDIQHSVGRLCFETSEEYARYAEGVVAAETGEVRRPRRATFFGVANPGDRATRLSAERLVRPLAERLAGLEEGWEVATRIGPGEATKAELTRLVGGKDGPALVFTASHGMGFPSTDPRQRVHQGALLTQEWPGPQRWSGPVPEAHYFSADDVGSRDHFGGLVTFCFACYGAGTPERDDFAHRTPQAAPRRLAPEPFVSRLSQRLLGHPGGSALATIGHVDRAWGYSFLWGDQAQLGVFEAALRLLLRGQPVGAAMEWFGQRYAELSADVTAALQAADYGERIDPEEVIALWTANNDARAYVVVGDPAVRLAVGPVQSQGSAGA